MADCERLHDGLLDEPVNTLSSLAYVAAGACVWRHDRVQGGALMLAGAGSVAYHGVGGSAARVLHDVSIVLLAVVVAGSARNIWRGAVAQPVLGAVALGAVVVAIPLQLLGRTGGPLCGPERVIQAHAAWHVLTAFALACVFIAADRERRLHVDSG